MDKKEHYSILEVANNIPFTVCPLESPNRYFRIVGSCRGVVCLADSYTGLPNFLWNPRIGKHVVVPMPLGFGVSDHDLKVVRLVYYGGSEEESDDDDDSSLGAQPEAEIFSVKTGRWRRFGVEGRLPNFEFAWGRAFVNGVMHWIGRRDSVKDELAMEDDLYLSLFSVGESLAVIQFNMGPGIDYNVWLMQVYGDESSWTRKYNFSLELAENVVAIWKNGVVWVASKRIGLYALDLENMETKNLEIYGDCCSFHVENYVESLELLGGHRDFAEEQNEGAKEDLIGDGVQI